MRINIIEVFIFCSRYLKTATSALTLQTTNEIVEEAGVEEGAIKEAGVDMEEVEISF